MRLPRVHSSTLLAVVVGLGVLAPFGLLVVQAHHEGWSQLSPLLLRGLTARLLAHTVVLAGAVAALCALVGTGAAYLVERTTLPARRLWAVLAVLPLGIPDFAIAYGWRSLFPALSGFPAALLVMTLGVYPLVYLPVAASLRRADPVHEEVARSLGAGRLAVFWRVTMGQARLAVLGGSLLVVLVVFAEYGAFEILGYRTFTTEIFTEFQVGFNTAAASALSLVLVLLGLAVVVGEGASRGRGRVSRSGPMAPRASRPRPLGRATGPALAALGGLAALGLGVPLGAIAYWFVQGGRTTLPGGSLLAAAGHSALYGALAAVVATGAALPVARAAGRRAGAVVEKATMVVLAMPGLVVALALAYGAEHQARGLFYQTPELLVAAYAVMFFPLALVAVRTALAQSPPALEEAGRALGRSRLSVFVRVTLPLIGPGLAAAASLVFLEAVTELTATLVLVPTGVQTLATQFWAYQSNASYAQAAAPAACMILVAAVPSYVLGRWFDRRPVPA